MSEIQAAALVDRYADMILRISYQYLKQTYDAQDICQTVFLKYLTGNMTFDSAEHEKAWIIRTTVNACKDHLKSAFFRRTVALDEAVNIPAPAVPESELLELLAELPYNYRISLYLFYYEEYSPKKSPGSWAKAKLPSTNISQEDGGNYELTLPRKGEFNHMKRNIRSEIKTSMDAIHFSREAKEAMTNALMAQMEEINMNEKKHTGRKILLVTLAATMLLATLTGAAVFTRWSATAQNRYSPSQDVKEQAEKSGLSVMLEETKGAENPSEVLSVTDQGITITAVQSIVDNYKAEITFRIEGFEVPEDEYPAVWPSVTIDGKSDFYTSQTGQIFDGTTRNEEGQWVYVSTGEPVRCRDDEYQSVILEPVAADGSIEFTHYISFDETDGRYLNKEIVFTFHSMDFESDQKAGMSEPQVEGNWELRWILTGTGSNIKCAPNAKIGDSDVILLDAEIGQLTLRTRYQLKDYWEGWDELVTLPQAVYGVRMKDGSEHICIPSTCGFEDQENMIYFIESTMFDAILDISQVESLMFHKGWELDANGEPTIQTFYYIPIQ